MIRDFEQLEWNAAIEDDCRQLVRLAVREDLDRGHDWTTLALVSAETQGRARVIARQGGVIAGLNAVGVVLDEMHAAVHCVSRFNDAQRVSAGDVIAELEGSARDMLTCERPILNFLGRLSGIATLTSQFVERVEGSAARIYDTRKTTPGWRRLEKYAVRCGGGRNHRTGLFDAVLIKDNHLSLAAADNLTPAAAVRLAREFIAALAEKNLAEPMLIEAEVDSLSQLDDVLSERPDIVLLDNMRSEDLANAVKRRNEIAPAVQLEASGGVSLDTVREIARTGVDRISSGALTHAAQWLDIALDWAR